jgi:hypothetical protein
LLRLRYHNSIADAVADLGRAEDIGKVFSSFQKYLYEQQAAAWQASMQIEHPGGLNPTPPQSL